MKRYKCTILNLSFLFVLISLLALQPIVAQTIQQEKMQHLSFLIGEWEGISTTYKNDTIATQVAAVTKISYKLDDSIIALDLQAETLQLHTVIYYDDKSKSYSYNPFYKGGAAKYTAQFSNDKLIVSPSKTKRFIFTTTPDGDFLEYGEILVDGEWQLYFKDVFKKVKY
ncbi:MAG: hypothetical protein AB8B52_01560 [Winogradskyella sp.]|uniref:hypothetical protein n=1 Tax=Winogradskyella sp. TaxID=1883156 RepID=UPI00385AC5D6